MEQQHDMRILAERTQFAAGLSLAYRLAFENGFWITVDCGEDAEQAFLGSDLESAWRLFCACVEGCVTPCTLDDVCRDYFCFQSSNIGI